MARRMPFGAKARAPTVEGTSSARASPRPMRANAVLPADQATAPSGPRATWSIHRRFASSATTLAAPAASAATTLPSSPPVTTRAPSPAMARMPPSCTATRRAVPSAATSSSASSPSASAATSPMKWTPTTGAPAAIGRVRSTTDGGSRASLIPIWSHFLRKTGTHFSGKCSEPLRRAGFKTFADAILGQVAADEHDPALALLAGLPRALVVAVEDHVDALEHEPRGVVLERQDALGAQDVRAVLGDEVLHPWEELVGIERLVGPQRDRLHLLVVIVLEPVAMAAIVTVAMIVTVVAVLMLLAVEEGGLDVENAVEVEGVAAEHLGQRHRATLGAVQLGVGIDAAHAHLDLAQLLRPDQVRLVDQDHVGERDLVLRLRGILEAVLEPPGVGHGDDRVELGLAAHRLVHEEGLGDRGRIGEPGGLHDDGVEPALAPHQAVDDAHEVAAHGAADAAVVHLEHFLVGADHQLVVDADLAELVDDDGELLPVRLGQDAVEQRGLAGAEIAGQHGDGNLVGHANPRNDNLAGPGHQLVRAAPSALILCRIMSM